MKKKELIQLLRRAIDEQRKRALELNGENPISCSLKLEAITRAQAYEDVLYALRDNDAIVLKIFAKVN